MDIVGDGHDISNDMTFLGASGLYEPLDSAVWDDGDDVGEAVDTKDGVRLASLVVDVDCATPLFNPDYGLFQDL